MSQKKPGKPTELAHTGRPRKWTHGLVSVPVHHASTITFETYEALRKGVAAMHDESLFYGRFGTPSQWALEEAITELEGGARTKLFPSGMAAIAGAMLTSLRAGDHMLVADTVYEPTRKLARGLMRRLGVECDFFDPLVGADIEGLMKDNTTVIMCESPGSLTMEVMDIPAIARVAHERGAIVILDNTWATPLYYGGLAHGADLVVHAVTKYIGGHSDLMMGSLTATKAWKKKLETTALQTGQTVGPDDAALAMRGLRTLEVRLARHGENAMKVARWLADQPMVDRVLYPALPTCPGHDIWKRDFSGACGLFSIVLSRGSEKEIGALTDGLRYFSMGYSWGGFESLILPGDPAPVRSATEWSAPGPLVRLHVGLEDPDDLIADLKAGLAAYEKATD